MISIVTSNLEGLEGRRMNNNLVNMYVCAELHFQLGVCKATCHGLKSNRSSYLAS